ncbi:MAG: thioredoxin-dependent thiol peroxidase [Acidobacteriota bacterium]
MNENKKIDTGDLAPDFKLNNQEDKEVTLSSYRGKWVVLYFYPRDNTPGCTTEAVEFSGVSKKLSRKGVEIIGISPDSTKSHRNFIEKKELNITLLSDPEHLALEKFGVWQLKKNYGREYYGVVRSTFIISPEGKIAHKWRSVKVKGHVEAVEKKLEELT